jgi:hypothetical protein
MKNKSKGICKSERDTERGERRIGSATGRENGKTGDLLKKEGMQRR